MNGFSLSAGGIRTSLARILRLTRTKAGLTVWCIVHFFNPQLPDSVGSL